MTPGAIPLAGCKLWCQEVEGYLFFQNFILGRSVVSLVYSRLLIIWRLKLDADGSLGTRNNSYRRENNTVCV
jgi:hypothetical protein